MGNARDQTMRPLERRGREGSVPCGSFAFCTNSGICSASRLAHGINSCLSPAAPNTPWNRACVRRSAPSPGLSFRDAGAAGPRTFSRSVYCVLSWEPAPWWESQTPSPLCLLWSLHREHTRKSRRDRAERSVPLVPHPRPALANGRRSRSAGAATRKATGDEAAPSSSPGLVLSHAALRDPSLHLLSHLQGPAPRSATVSKGSPVLDDLDGVEVGCSARRWHAGPVCLGSRSRRGSGLRKATRRDGRPLCHTRGGEAPPVARLSTAAAGPVPWPRPSVGAPHRGHLPPSMLSASGKSQAEPTPEGAVSASTAWNSSAGANCLFSPLFILLLFTSVSLGDSPMPRCLLCCFGRQEHVPSGTCVPGAGPSVRGSALPRGLAKACRLLF